MSHATRMPSKQLANQSINRGIKRSFHSTTQNTVNNINNYNNNLNNAFVDLTNTLQQHSTKYRRTLQTTMQTAGAQGAAVQTQLETQITKSAMRAYHYSQYQSQILRNKNKHRKLMNNIKFGPSMSKNNNSIKFSNNIKSGAINNTQKLLTMSRQRYLPVRQFDTIANEFYDVTLQNLLHHSKGCGRGLSSSGSCSSSNGAVIALLPPPSHASKIYLQIIRNYIKYNKLLNAINKKFVMYPLLAGSIFAMLKSVMADLFAQRCIDNKPMNDINWRRNAVFAFVGLFWTGFVHYGLYYKLYPRLFYFTRNWHWCPKASFQSLFDTTFHSALFYYPMFYCVKEIAYNGFNIENCKNGVSTYWNQNFWKDYKALISVWFPSHLITFGLMPAHLRVPWIAIVSFAWTVLLSVMRGEKDKNIEQSEVQAVMQSEIQSDLTVENKSINTNTNDELKQSEVNFMLELSQRIENELKHVREVNKEHSVTVEQFFNDLFDKTSFEQELACTA